MPASAWGRHWKTGHKTGVDIGRRIAVQKDERHLGLESAMLTWSLMVIFSYHKYNSTCYAPPPNIFVGWSFGLDIWTLTRVAFKPSHQAGLCRFQLFFLGWPAPLLSTGDRLFRAIPLEKGPIIKERLFK
jgi:hypothetical protein